MRAAWSYWDKKMAVDKKYSEFESVGSVSATDTSVGERSTNPLGQKYIRPTYSQIAAFSLATNLPFKFVSDWNALTNSPALASGAGTEGLFYRVSTSGSTNLDGITDWDPDDFAWFDGTVWRQNKSGDVHPVPTQKNFDFTATAGKTIFTPLPSTPTTPASVIVNRNGQGVPGSDFSIVGTTLTWLGVTLTAGERISGHYVDIS